MIDVTLLGTNALLPLPDRAEAAATLEYEGHIILFDCGEGTQTAARKAGVNLMKTDLIALTHYHGDHIFGIPGLLQTMNILGRTNPLYITGPGDVCEELSAVFALMGRLMFDVIGVNIENGEVPLKEILGERCSAARLMAFKTKHTVKSCGYAFVLERAGEFDVEKALKLNLPKTLWSVLQRGQAVEYNGRQYLPRQVLGKPRKGLKVVFSGDTSPCASLTEYAADADLLMHEATYAGEEYKDKAWEFGHSTFFDAATQAKKAKVKLLWLMHFSQVMTDPTYYLSEATDVFKNTECGFDGKHISLKFE